MRLSDRLLSHEDMNLVIPINPFFILKTMAVLCYCISLHLKHKNKKTSKFFFSQGWKLEGFKF